MKISTLYYFISSVPSKKIPASYLEEVSFLSFSDVKEYLDMEEEKVRDAVVNKIIAKIKR
jgi:predicted nucleic acid-binding OB-fold protein